MDWITNPEIWISLVTLTVLGIVLGIDNLNFISILSGKVLVHQQRKARQLGLAAALVTRILLLAGLSWVVKLDRPFWKPKVFSFQLGVDGDGEDSVTLSRDVVHLLPDEASDSAPVLAVSLQRAHSRDYDTREAHRGAIRRNHSWKESCRSHSRVGLV